MTLELRTERRGPRPLRSVLRRFAAPAIERSSLFEPSSISWWSERVAHLLMDVRDPMRCQVREIEALEKREDSRR